ATAVLPSVGGEPLAPPNTGFGPDPGQGRMESSPWGLTGLVLEPLDALLTLTSFSDSPGVRLGDDWRYWTKVGQLALELMGRERIVPALSLTGDAPRAHWRVLTSDRHDAERLGSLALAMPPACRSLTSPPSEARALLLGALDAMADAAVRCWAPDVGQPSSAGSMGVNGKISPGQRWFQALMRQGDNAFELEPLEVVTLAQHLGAWTQPLMPPPEAPFRTCLRLESPPEGAPASALWRLEFALQASDDPSLIIPAQQVWRGSGAEAGFLARRFDRPQERLLEDLGRAAKLFPPIQRGLKSSHPEAVELETEEAYTFLRQAAPQLEEAGYGVLMPPWWRQNRSRLGVKVTMREAGPMGTLPGKMGHRALVDYDWSLALGDETIDKEEFERLVKMKMPLLKIRGKWVELDPEQIQSALKFFENADRQGQMSVLEAMKLATVPEGQAGGLSIVSVQAEGDLGEFLGNFGPGDWMAGVVAPENFKGVLRPYQERGYGWLASMRKWGMGACLADDMGLGKTIQVLALLLKAKADREAQGVPASRFAADAPQPWLLVCPTSLVGNWLREARSFAPDLKVYIHHGANRSKGVGLVRAIAGHDLVITTYTLLFRDEVDLAQTAWTGLIFDEAQNIKNHTSKQAQSARKMSADWRVALTGTPVENHLSDLWSIMDVLNPGYLGSSKQFANQFGVPIERFKDEYASAKLRQFVMPFLLRRLKTDPTIIQDLPEKNEQKVYCPLTKEQATLYSAIVREVVSKVDSAAGGQRRMQVLASLTKLKQITDHPALFMGDGSELPGRSGKLTRLTEMLEELQEVGDRALVFTQFAEMGKLLQTHLSKVLGRPIPFLYGSVSASDREKMVREFQDAKDAAPVLILSLKAGGVGLNLTRANHVFHYDRWWNPAVENQATDRAFRIGQTRNVMVHKFLCLGTLEEKIDQMLEDKKTLSSLVVGEGEGWLTELSTDQLRDILALRDEALAVE
ncbi:MAG: box helicase, partial [Cyanobacteria bacterium RYN_339]|nr:box helicase [Cyanobacteria bacterium RYN_339]